MPSAEAEKIIAELRAKKGATYPSVMDGRKQWEREADAKGMPEGVKTSAVVAGGVICEWVEHPDAEGDRVLMWLHGGGFWRGAPATHKRFAAYLSQITKTKVLLPDYRLAPEHPFPAGVHDCLSVYGALLADGVSARHIALGGDASGGGLAASMLVALKEADGPMPSSLSMCSPWLDLTMSSDSIKKNADTDPSVTLERLKEMAGWYIDQASASAPILSPFFADLDGFPPIHVQVSDNEILLDDARIFAQHAKSAGVIADLQTFVGLWHMWQLSAPDVPEAKEAVAKMAGFIASHFGD